MSLSRLTTMLAVSVMLGVPAFADFSTSFTANGTSATDGRTQKGTAVFTLTGSTFTVTLTNNSNPTTGISSTLVGVVFHFTNGSTAVLTGINTVTPTGI